jgi:hypothetical protein
MQLLAGCALAFFASAPQAHATSSTQAELNKAISKITTCIEKQKNCRFHIIGIVSPNPMCQFSVMPNVWSTFSSVEREAVVELGKLYLDWVRLNPVEAASSVKRGAGISKEAPIFGIAVRQLGKVSRCQVALAFTKDKHGLPGWAGDVQAEPKITR